MLTLLFILTVGFFGNFLSTRLANLKQKFGDPLAWFYPKKKLCGQWLCLRQYYLE